MRVLDLFAGIGGFSLAAHWAGWETAAFVEWDKFCQKVLTKNFPDVPIYGDIKDFHYEQEKEQIGPVDLICGGFPCQPFSHAGKRNGTADDRYLWPEMLRVIREVKPSWVVGENVAGLLSMDGGAVFESVCASLEDEGYTVEAFVIPAISCGAPHRRDRVWITANSKSKQDNATIKRGFQSEPCGADSAHGVTSDACRSGARGEECPDCGQGRQCTGTPQSKVVRCGNREINSKGIDAGNRQLTPNPEGPKREPSGRTRAMWDGFADGNFQSLLVGDTNKQGLEGHRGFIEHPDERAVGSANWGEHWYEVATRICRVDARLPRRMDRSKRLKALGNAIVPQVAYEIFRAINETKA